MFTQSIPWLDGWCIITAIGFFSGGTGARIQSHATHHPLARLFFLLGAGAGTTLSVFLGVPESDSYVGAFQPLECLHLHSACACMHMYMYLWVCALPPELWSCRRSDPYMTARKMKWSDPIVCISPGCSVVHFQSEHTTVRDSGRTVRLWQLNHLCSIIIRSPIDWFRRAVVRRQGQTCVCMLTGPSSCPIYSHVGNMCVQLVLC